MTDRPNERRKFEGVRKDPLDLRDVMYEPSLQELPFRIDKRDKVPMILDQGREGACTGFALAAVANFLIHNRSDIGPLAESVSARMFYEMAKRYDEWEGEDYEGSSIRGAMKGWHKHGVCTELEWPYTETPPGTLTPARQLAALNRRLGAYFRVRHLHLNHMHSALNEVGILYASAVVHEGWYEVDRTTGKIPLRRTPAGAHAFAIIGYDDDGFWIQNSWGPDWGLGGFCHITYDDWLENGYDCWVARLGVPTTSVDVDERSVSGRVAEFDYVPHEAVVLATIRPHFVNLGNDGVLSTSGRYQSDADEVREIIHGSLKGKAEEWGGTPKLLLYAHGGLNDEKASATRINSMLPYFLANQIYPLHFMWETGLGDAIRGIVEDAFRQKRFQGWLDSMRDRFYDLLDEAIELGSRRLGQPIWGQMKDNAERASLDPDGGAAFVASQIADYSAAAGPVELHLVGHSAGSVFHAYLIPRLIELGLPIKTLTFYAPACTTKLFKLNILGHFGTQIERLTILNLTDRYEQDDTATPLYHKSLLYLVSGAFEEGRNKPLLGMDTFIGKDQDIKSVLGKPTVSGESTVIYSVGGPSDISLASQSTTHGGFDNDEHTLNSTLRIIRGSNQLNKRF
jgi:hypothetical protein